MTRPLAQFGWLLAAAASAYACALVVPAHATPIDRALPVVAILVTLAAWGARETAVQMAVPLLMIAAVTLGDERLRLLTYGVIVAVAFAAVARAAFSEANGAGRLGTDDRELTSAAAPWLALAAIALLRWIPLDSVVVWREALVLAGAAALFYVSRDPIATTLVAAATPLFPLKTLFFPLVIAALIALLPARFRFSVAIVFAVLIPFTRYSFAPLLAAAALALLGRHARLVAAPVALLLVVLFPWSGAAIHAMPPLLLAVVVGIAVAGSLSPVVAAAAGVTLLFCMPDLPRFQSTPVVTAITPGTSLTLDVAPTRTVAITASGANVLSLRRGELGTVEGFDAHGRVVARRAIAIGDVADWGFMRREHLFSSHNRLPHEPTWRIIDYGAASWVYGAGRVTLTAPRHIEMLRITASPSLPAGARLQIESVEMPAR